MEVDAVAGIRLNIGFEIGRRDFWKVLRYSGWDGGQGRVACCETIAAAVREVVCFDSRQRVDSWWGMRVVLTASNDKHWASV